MHGFLVHAAFDVLAWLAAGIAGLWLMRSGRVVFPVPQPLRFGYLAALVFGAGARRSRIRLSKSVALRDARHRPLDRRGDRGRHPGDRDLQGDQRHHAAHRRALRAAVRGRRRGRADRLFPLRARRFHLRHADDACRGAHDFGDGVPRHPVQLYESAAMAAFAAALSVARAAPRPLRHRERLLSCCRLLRRCSASSGSSSSPTARWSGRSRCFTCCPRPSSSTRSR